MEALPPVIGKGGIRDFRASIIRCCLESSHSSHILYHCEIEVNLLCFINIDIFLSPIFVMMIIVLVGRSSTRFFPLQLIKEAFY